MKIGLVSSLMKDNDIEHQLQQMEYYFSINKNCDLICFGESFLQGFRGLTWRYDEDINRALTKDDPIIIYIRELTKKYKCGVSFGFIEKEDKTIYSSNMVINPKGEIVDIFRRVSPGWKEPVVNTMYQEGSGFHTFIYMGKVLGVAICGDIWHDNLLRQLENMKMDLLLWPLYVDFSIEVWNKDHRDDYAERTKNISGPVLMINSFIEEPKRAKGGCYVFHENQIVSSLPTGNIGILEFDLDDYI